ncbi:DUF4231 domain-containing protein [Mesomycoplasma hyorhinis]|uniref:DUF4231 domain-containing protein n=1 Tax=Mesomycoplasma hyorhinis TaxID=2100 RepID=UPI001C05C97F|nr:DUF4231 domain-containing protein [Mesomycoplasma hyorhinis]
MLKSVKLTSSGLEFANYLYSKTSKKAKIYQIIFWSCSLFAIFFAFFASIMGVFKLASSRLEEFKPFATIFQITDTSGDKPVVVDQWPIFTLWINIILSIVNGLIALFLVKNKWIRNKELNNFLGLELILFHAKEGKYKNNPNPELTLLEKVNDYFGNISRLKAREEKHE